MTEELALVLPHLLACGFADFLAPAQIASDPAALASP
jgi:hypothetical protein